MFHVRHDCSFDGGERCDGCHKQVFAVSKIWPDLSQLRLGLCLWIVLVLVRAFWVRRVGH